MAAQLERAYDNLNTQLSDSGGYFQYPKLAC